MNYRKMTREKGKGTRTLKQSFEFLKWEGDTHLGSVAQKLENAKCVQDVPTPEK